MTGPSGQLLNLTILDWQPKETVFSDPQRLFFLMSPERGYTFLFIKEHIKYQLYRSW